MPSKAVTAAVTLCALFSFAACAPQVVHMAPTEGAPGTTVNVFMKYLVGWPRVEIGRQTMNYYDMKLLGTRPESKDLPGEELTWIEDKILQFQIPRVPPGDYTVTIHDDKGPPGDKVYSVLETTAYVIFPPVWPFVFRSNQAQVAFRVLPIREDAPDEPRVLFQSVR